MGLCRNRSDLAQALRNFLNRCCVVVVDFVRAVQHLCQTFNIAFVLIRGIHRKQKLICHLCGGITDNLRFRGKLCKRFCLIAIACSCKSRNRFQILVSRNAVSGSGGIRLFFNPLHLFGSRARNLSHGDKLIVNRFHRCHGILKRAYHRCDRGVNYLPCNDFRRNVAERIAEDFRKAG